MSGASFTGHELAERLGVPPLLVVIGWQALCVLGLPPPQGDRWPAAAVEPLISSDRWRQHATIVLWRLSASQSCSLAPCARNDATEPAAPPGKVGRR